MESLSEVRAEIQWQLFCFSFYVFSLSSTSLKTESCLFHLEFCYSNHQWWHEFKIPIGDLTILSTVENNNWDISGRVFWFCNIDYVTGRMKRWIKRWQFLQCDVGWQSWIQDKHWHLDAMCQQTLQLLLTGNRHQHAQKHSWKINQHWKACLYIKFSRCFSISYKNHI